MRNCALVQRPVEPALAKLHDQISVVSNATREQSQGGGGSNRRAARTTSWRS